MTNDSSRWCVLLPCSADQAWAVPQQCLAEIVTVTSEDDAAPQQITWRGEAVPVVDYSGADASSWRDRRSGAGLVAVLLGLKGADWRYWGVAVRGDGLGVSQMEEEQMEDVPDAVLEHSSAAFRMHGTVYQVPDLDAVQRSIGSGSTSAP